MQSTSTPTGHIARTEWRWVALISLTLLASAFAPFLAIALRSSPGAAFMGILHQYQNAVGNLSQVQQGGDGLWLVYFQYTPEPHRSALIQPVYALLGQIARLVMMSPVTIFHIARLIAAFFMYMALYHLAASIWMKVRTRRIYFIIAAIGSGLGWLFASLTGTVDYADLTAAQAFPFLSSLVNVHYPLTIACLAILVSVLVAAFRPGMTESPAVTNGGLVAVLMSLALAFLYPESLLGIGAALAGSIAALWYRERQVERELRWALWVLVPTLPVIAYYFVTLRINPAVLEWVHQKAQESPSPVALVIGLGIPLVLAIPGIYRAVRRFERDGDRFMLLWLVTMMMVLYLPIDVRREAIAGLMLPVAYFATRAMEDFWLQFIGRRDRRRMYILAVPLLALSNLYALLVPVVPLLVENRDITGVALEPDYVAAFDWLKTQVSRDDVILAAPDDVSAWIPVWTEARVVYGHPVQTLNAAQRYQEVKNWYNAGDEAAPVCSRILEQDGYRVVFVLDGVRERRINENNERSACLDNLEFAASFGQVNIFTTEL